MCIRDSHHLLDDELPDITIALGARTLRGGEASPTKRTQKQRTEHHGINLGKNSARLRSMAAPSNRFHSS
eukprot:9429328-Alexandrium_andersonii.AAC.1